MDSADGSGKSGWQAAAVLAVFLLIAGSGVAAEAEKSATNSVQVPPSVIKEELAPFRVKPGFRVELAAVEPMVQGPVAMAFDENGRLFVVERRGPTEGRGEVPRTGRVRLLEDVDEEGAYRSSTVYADDVPDPSAVACYGGGIFVAAGANITYFKDTKGDGVADVRHTVLTGFGGTNAPGGQAVLNNFNWGLDNRIHGATAGLGGVITAPDLSGFVPVSITGGDFSFDPRTLAVFPEAGPTQSGLSFNNQGRRFGCDFAHPLRLEMSAPRYAALNPFFARLPQMVEVASPLTQVYGFVSMPAPRHAAARPAAAGARAPAIMGETKVLAAAWLTMARGCAVYRGSAFPPGYAGNVFIAAPEAHAIHRAVLVENGLGALATQAPDERNTEFLLSKEPSFHPVQVINGPDGALYVVDAQDGNERGRILRIVPEKFRRPQPPHLGKAKTYDLVAALAQPDGWHRDTAARLLFERRDPAAAALLSNMASHSRVPLACLHALHALDGLGAMREAQVLRCMGDESAWVREHALLLSERLATNGVVSDELWGQLKALAGDPSVRVRYQLALTLGEIRRPDKAWALAEILRRDGANSWVQNAVLGSLAEGAADLFILLGSEASIRSSPAGQEFLRRLGLMLGTRGRLDETSQALNFIDRQAMEPTLAFGLLYAIGEGLHRTRSALFLLDTQGELRRFYIAAAIVLGNGGGPEQARVEAIRLLGVGSTTYADIGHLLLPLCDPRESGTVQSAALWTLGRYVEPRIVTDLLARWPGLTPPLRRQTLSALLVRSDRVAAVLAALEAGKLSASDVSPVQQDFLRTFRQADLSERAVRLFGPVALARPKVLQQYKPALRMRGASEHGSAIFLERCAECHQLGEQGRAFGPELTGARFHGKEKILEAILQPGAEVAPEYATCVAETKAGENLVGIKQDENLATVTLRQPDGTQAVWPRLNLQSIETRRWSLMPAGLEEGLSLQDMADLLEYLMTAPDSR